MSLPVNKPKVLKFSSDTSQRKRWFTPESFAHPAKMVLPLQIYLIEHYTKAGETILDPMAGSGTLLVGCALGRNVICVELEEKFIKMQQDNWQKIKSLGPMLGYGMGEAQIIQGDARNLDNVLVDKCIFSPPYAEAIKGGPGGIDWTKGTRGKAEGNKPRDRSKEPAYNHLPGMALDWGYSRDPINIGNLPYGEISAVISSPPYEGSDVSETHMNSNKRGDPSNPNYRPSWKDKIKDGYCETKRPYSGPRADAVITSPPYEGSLEASSRHTKGGMPERDKKVGQSGTYADLDPSVERLRKHGRTDTKAGGPYGQSLAHPYSPAAENIGNLKSENYLEAMLQVYRQCHKVLRPGGLMILVVKPFIRDKKIVPLHEHTKDLCEKAGFVFVEELHRKLTTQSFWRVIYKQKYPDAPEIKTEYILIFRRPGRAAGRADRAVG